MPRNTVEIGTEEPTAIVPASDPLGDYEIVVTGATPIVLNDRRRDVADREGRELEPGRPAIVTKDQSTEAIYAISDGVEASEVSIEKTRFSIVKLPPMTLQGERQNRPGYRVETLDVSSETSFSALPVPDGYDVVVRADVDNGDAVELRDGEGGALPLEPGASTSLGVVDRSEITVAPSSGTQTVHATVEV
jgi:hypothetical protein